MFTKLEKKEKSLPEGSSPHYLEGKCPKYHFLKI